MEVFDIRKFEDSRRDEGTSYWLAHEFMQHLGYENWQAFQGVITKAMGACAKLGLDPTDSFITDTHFDGAKVQKTYRLTRFACFLVSMSADSNKPQVAKAKAILAGIAAELVQEKIKEGDLGRIETRDDLKHAEKQMSSVAMSAGLEATNFGLFKDAGFRGMYNMGLPALRQRKGVDGKETLYDFMGLEELAGNLFRVTQTTARIKSQNVQGSKPLMQTATEVGKEVRHMMLKNSGVPPEALPIEQDISQVKKRLKTANKAMKKLDAGKAITGTKK